MFLQTINLPRGHNLREHIQNQDNHIEDKHIEDNFPAQLFREAFQIGFSQDLSRSKRCFSSREGVICRGHPNSGKYPNSLDFQRYTQVRMCVISTPPE